MPVLLIKSLTSIAGDIPKSMSLSPASVITVCPVGVSQFKNVLAPCCKAPAAE